MRSFFQKLKTDFSLEFCFELFLLLIFYLAALYLADGSVLFGSGPQDPIPLPLFITAIFCELSCLTGILIWQIKKYKYRPNLILISILSVLFIIQLVTILTFKNGRTYSVVISDGSTYSFDYSMEPLEYVRYIFGALSICTICFITLDFLPQKYKNNDYFVTLFAFLMIGFAIASIIGSFVLEPERIGGLFKLEQFSDLPSLALKSFYPSKNAYALVLLCGALSIVYLALKEHKIYLTIALILLQIPIFLTQAKLCIALGLITLVGYGLIRFFQTYKNNEKRNWIILASIVGTILLISIILLVIPKTNEIIRGVLDNIFQEKFGKSTMDGRTKIWEYSFVELSYFNIFTGAGYKIFNVILGKFNCADVAYYVTFDTNSPHNAYIQLLGNGGIALLLVYLAIFGLLVYVLIKIFKKNTYLAAFEVIVLISILALSVFEEGTIIFPQTGEFMFLTALFAVPLLQERIKE